MQIKFQEYPLPIHESGPYGITVGRDGAQWFTENKGNQIGRMTGEIKEIKRDQIQQEYTLGTLATRSLKQES